MMARTTGKPGPAPKPDRTSRNALALVPVEEQPLPTPAAPKGLGPAGRGLWRSFWASESARAVKEPDVDLLVRLVRYRDLWETCMASGEAFDQGAQGQERIAPTIELALKLEKEMQRLASDLGMTPFARAKLFGTAATAAKQVAAWTKTRRS
jgi:P27 family predicted phage terminase small subunit